MIKRAFLIFSGYSPVVALAGLVTLFALLEPGFLSSFNIYSLLAQVALLGITALGLTAAISAGEFDVAIGSNFTFCSVVAMAFLAKDMPVTVAVSGALFFGLLIGLLKSAVIVKFRVHSIVATLAIAVVLDGCSLVYTGGYRLYRGATPEFRFLGSGKLGLIPMPALIMLIMLVALWFLTTQTSLGWRLYSVGEQPQVARLLGVSPNRYKSYGLLISSLMAALAGILYAARTGTAEPFGKFAYTLDSFVAVTIGQTLLLRGKPNILGTLVGVFILGVLSNGVVLVGAPFFLQEIVKGVLILIGVVIIARLQWG